ncbi:RNA-directed DNA polymerase, eukaryota, reverse transcriptase zinc-binding domain protein, partial [Tanacetum coccineum]
LQLIVSVLASMHIYRASVFLIPKTIVKEIEKSQRGLGFKRLGPWNEALLCKHLWNIFVKKESLRVNWVNLVIFKGKSIWEINDDVSYSGIWKAILNLRSKIRNNVWYEIGDDRKTNVWYDKLNDIGPLDEFIPLKKYEARFFKQMNVADLTDNGNWIWPNGWRNHFHKLSNMNIIVLIEGKEDRVMWIGNNGKKDKFSIRSVWEIFKQNRNDVSGHKVVWYPQCNQRHDFILWLSLHGRLATQDRLMVWNNQNNLLCPL